MATWVTIPSARPVAEVTAWCSKWHTQGYKIALWRDTERVEAADICIVGEYQGYSKSANAVIRLVLDSDSTCDWVVCCGDDTWPDPNKKADEIAVECYWYFGGDPLPLDRQYPIGHYAKKATFGIMQPTGDDWRDHQGRIIERIAGSPWIGRQYALRINGGQGPWWPDYRHNWADEECKLVAESLGVYWMRPDLCHFHDHCMRYPGGKWAPHLQHVSADYTRMKPLFEERRKNGFPGSEPL